jgi:hypothetical protein
MRNFYLLLLWLPCIAAAQNNNANWLNFTTAGTVNDLELEGDYAWVSTNGGLVRHQVSTGVSEFFNRANLPLPHQQINDMAIAPDGTKWLGTPIGLVQWSGDEMTLHQPSSSTGSLIQLSIRSVGLDSSGAVWLTSNSNNRRLGVFRPGSGWTFFPDLDFLGESVQISSLKTLSTKAGAYFLVTSFQSVDQLIHFDGVTTESFPIPTDPTFPFQELDVSDWLVDAQGRFWWTNGTKLYLSIVGGGWEETTLPFWANALLVDPTDATSLLYVLTSEQKIYSRNTDGSFDPVTTITGFENYMTMRYSADGKIWLFSPVDLHYVSGNSYISVPVSQSALSGNTVSELVIRGQQEVWVACSGEYAEGMSVFNGQNWQDLSISGQVRDMCTDGTGRVLAARYNQLGIWDGNNWQIIPAVNYPLDPIEAVACQPGTQNIWVGGYSFIGNIQGDTYEQIPLPDNCFGVELAVDLEGGVWMIFNDPLGEHGLAKYHNGDWTFFPAVVIFEGIDLPNLINDIVISPEGWVFALAEFNIVFFDGTSWQVLDTPFPYWNFSSIAFQGPEHYWIGCTFDFYSLESGSLGLVEINNGVTTVYPYNQYPLNSSDITRIALDSFQNIWIGTERGIAVFNPTGVVLNAIEPVATGSKTPLLAFPNPAVTESNLVFDLPQRGDLRFRLFNSAGALVLEQHHSDLSPQQYQLTVERPQAAGGCYFWEIEGAGFRHSGELLFR